MARKYKTATRTCSALGAFEEGKTEIECLRDEMSDWASNLESGGLDHTEKYTQVEEARDNLDNAVSDLDGVDFPSATGDAEVDYTEISPYGRKPQPRWMRLANATALLEAAKSALEGAKEAAEDASGGEDSSCECDATPEDAETPGDHHELDCPLCREEGWIEDDDDGEEGVDFDSPIDAIDEALQNLESVEFPGMY